jgi:hypothetical protein
MISKYKEIVRQNISTATEENIVIVISDPASVI